MTTQSPEEQYESVSLCPHCHCMTHDIPSDTKGDETYCGKCGKLKSTQSPEEELEQTVREVVTTGIENIQGDMPGASEEDIVSDIRAAAEVYANAKVEAELEVLANQIHLEKYIRPISPYDEGVNAGVMDAKAVVARRLAQLKAKGA